MKSAIFSLLLLLVAICLAAWHALPASAGSATWTGAGGTNTWSDPANWNPMTVPNGPSDVATFATSNSTSVTLARSDEVADLIFASNASAFTITQQAGTRW